MMCPPTSAGPPLHGATTRPTPTAARSTTSCRRSSASRRRSASSAASTHVEHEPAAHARPPVAALRRDGQNCQPIVGAVNPTYIPTDHDVGSTSARGHGNDPAACVVDRPRRPPSRRARYTIDSADLDGTDAVLVVNTVERGSFFTAAETAPPSTSRSPPRHRRHAVVHAAPLTATNSVRGSLRDRRGDSVPVDTDGTRTSPRCPRSP